jgi:hypothetical protein
MHGAITELAHERRSWMSALTTAIFAKIFLIDLVLSQACGAACNSTAVLATEELWGRISDWGPSRKHH